MSSNNRLAELHIDNYIKTALDISNYFDDQEERETMLKDLGNIVELYCKLKEKIKTVPAKSQEIIGKYINFDDDKIDYKEMSKKLSEELESFQPDISGNKAYEDFTERMKTLYKSNSNNGDEDLLCTQQEVNIIDPFTKTQIQEPVKNKCGHVYDLATVTAVVKGNAKTRCPVVGCKSRDFIVLSDLVTDMFTKAYLKKHSAQ